MSKVKVQVEHIPSFKEYQASMTEVWLAMVDYKIRVPMGLLQANYFTTDREGWAKLVYNLAFDSRLYRYDRRDCDWYAFKAMVVCRERYGLNTMGYASGFTPQGYHAFNIIYLSNNEILLWEPNDGFEHSGELFDIGEYGYKPDKVII